MIASTASHVIDALPLGSPRVGETVVVSRDVLVETARVGSGAPLVWRLVAASTRGKLLGWRAREREETRAVLEVLAAGCRTVVYVRPCHIESPLLWDCDPTDA